MRVAYWVKFVPAFKTWRAMRLVQI
jgi:hypothetical protein